MKNIHINLLILFFITLSFLMYSCNDDLLEEVPLDFFTPENSYQTFANFQSAITGLYAITRSNMYEEENISAPSAFGYMSGTDIIMNARGDSRRMGDYALWMQPLNNDLIRRHWSNWFILISNSNTILSRVTQSQMTNEQIVLVSAEARFFRALAYRYLVYLYGGVPILLEELTSPRSDFARASRDEVLNQIQIDLEYAAENLPDINLVEDGRVSKLVANHFLAETYISLGQYNQAILAASVVIDNPNTALMTSRFGRRSTVSPGDVYWDLFQRGNQNRRSANNQEALWVAQFETDVPGGAHSSGSVSNLFHLERAAGPTTFATFRDPDGVEGALGVPLSDYNSGGRGSSFLMNTDFYLYDLWEGNWDNDIRNAPHNIVRDFFYNNPNSVYYDSSSVKYPSPTRIAQSWRWYPWPTKITTPGDHPDDVYADKENQILKNSAGSTYRDDYYLRLAETYLLRAEAYLLNGNSTSAAMDINTVRLRVNANPVDAGEVTLDYILDERARELVYEEDRAITLRRTGTLLERVRKHNPLNANNIMDHHVLWPIPFSEIEANTDAVMVQNPGYN
ncbi:MAG: RagB/SusD family nutrient uptake outer membrane protein [Cyclobacteriaceae bacterium]|nr:RagB/SusD family nutrient uptake outer membrane protein [Cyclobacteriaceae bacterium]